MFPCGCIRVCKALPVQVLKLIQTGKRARRMRLRVDPGESGQIRLKASSFSLCMQCFLDLLHQASRTLRFFTGMWSLAGPAKNGGISSDLRYTL
jgi:hypothetical protein